MPTSFHSLRCRFQPVAERRSEHTAIIDGDGCSISYRELLEQIEQCSVILLDQLKGWQRPHVGVLMGNSIAQIVAVFALSKINAVVVPLNPKLNDEQICQALSATGVW